MSIQTKIIDPTINYFKASIEELKKVAWPTRAETVRYSMLVIAISGGLALAIGVLDFALNFGVEKLIDLIS